jgi:hypothetical protein
MIDTKKQNSLSYKSFDIDGEIILKEIIDQAISKRDEVFIINKDKTFDSFRSYLDIKNCKILFEGTDFESGDSDFTSSYNLIQLDKSIIDDGATLLSFKTGEIKARIDREVLKANLYLSLASDSNMTNGIGLKTNFHLFVLKMKTGTYQRGFRILLDSDYYFDTNLLVWLSTSESPEDHPLLKYYYHLLLKQFKSGKLGFDYGKDAILMLQLSQKFLEKDDIIELQKTIIKSAMAEFKELSSLNNKTEHFVEFVASLFENVFININGIDPKTFLELINLKSVTLPFIIDLGFYLGAESFDVFLLLVKNDFLKLDESEVLPLIIEKDCLNFAINERINLIFEIAKTIGSTKKLKVLIFISPFFKKDEVSFIKENLKILYQLKRKKLIQIIEN